MRRKSATSAFAAADATQNGQDGGRVARPKAVHGAPKAWASYEREIVSHDERTLPVLTQGMTNPRRNVLGSAGASPFKGSSPRACRWKTCAPRA